jgi:CRISPR-associated endonuclease Csn1
LVGEFVRVLGLDTGIASVGWSLIDVPDEPTTDGRVVAAGTWMFDPPEDKGQTGTKLRSAKRRVFRGQRRVIRRRRQRMAQIRLLFAETGLLPSHDPQALKQPGIDPWRVRVAALREPLAPVNLAVALGHIARHRGFKSNAKGGAANAADDTGKMKKASAETREKLARFGTPARLLLESEDFVLRQTPRRDGGVDEVRRLRNREGDYSRSLLRDDLLGEVRDIFRAQRALGSRLASAEVEERFIAIAFFQRELQDSERMIGSCPFEPAEKRTAKRAPSYEMFRLLSRLNALTITEGRNARPLSVEEIGLAAAEFGHTAKLSFAALRKRIGLHAAAAFDGVKLDEESKRDVVARSGAAAEGTARLRRVVAGQHGEMAWHALAARPEVVDRVAEVISFREDLARIEIGLAELDLDVGVRATLLAAAAAGDFDAFTGAGHISAKAARAMIPGLMQGLTYDKAAALAGYDHTASRERHAFDVGVDGKEALARIIKGERVSRDLVGSPTARKALIEALKQVKAIVEEFGLPDRIHVEVARDVGNSIEQRGEIERGIEKRNKEKDRMRALFADQVGRPPQDGERGAEELLRFELWTQQNGRCLYTGAYISPPQLVAGDNSFQVDHILPWSRFGDDSFHNKTLCAAGANQEKKGRTPWEWYQADKTPEEWDLYVARVGEAKTLRGLKRRNYLLKNAAEVAERFRSRNLNDTRWTCRLLAEALRQVLPDFVDDAGKTRRRVFVRPGALTDKLRRAWGVQWIKKDDSGKRIPDDRHHALDAIIVAATTESLLQRATKEVQEIEDSGRHYDLTKNVTPPWPGFRDAAIDAVEKVFVARAERRRARGKAHDATVRQIGEVDGEETVFERRPIAKLTLADLDRVKDLDRNEKLIASLRAWIEGGKPADAPPLSPKGDPIAKVRLVTKANVAIRMFHGGPDEPPGTVDRGEMARVDVFTKANARGKVQFFLVPIYPHQIATMERPPNRAVTAAKPESEWPEIDMSFEYNWPIFGMSFVRAINAKGEIFEGYYRAFDRATGAINVSPHNNLSIVKTGIGARTLLTFEKLQVDRLGRAHPVGREIRTWRGVACT